MLSFPSKSPNVLSAEQPFEHHMLVTRSGSKATIGNVLLPASGIVLLCDIVGAKSVSGNLRKALASHK